MKSLKHTLLAAVVGAVGLTATAQAADVDYGFWSLPAATVSTVTALQANKDQAVEVHYGYWSVADDTNLIALKQDEKQERFSNQTRMIGPGLIAPQS